jgi:hypothetical protein
MWDVNTGKCTACPPGQQWNPNMQVCVACTNPSQCSPIQPTPTPANTSTNFDCQYNY